jgi:hypothetical protein
MDFLSLNMFSIFIKFKTFYLKIDYVKKFVKSKVFYVLEKLIYLLFTLNVWIILITSNNYCLLFVFQIMIKT